MRGLPWVCHTATKSRCVSGDGHRCKAIWAQLIFLLCPIERIQTYIIYISIFGTQIMAGFNAWEARDRCSWEVLDNNIDTSLPQRQVFRYCYSWCVHLSWSIYSQRFPSILNSEIRRNSHLNWAVNVFKFRWSFVQILHVSITKQGFVNLLFVFFLLPNPKVFLHISVIHSFCWSFVQILQVSINMTKQVFVNLLFFFFFVPKS